MHFCYGSKIAVVESRTFLPVFIKFFPEKALEMVHDGEQYSHGTISVEDVRKRIQETKQRKAEEEIFSF